MMSTNESSSSSGAVYWPESASPATGSGNRHQQEQAEIVNDALTPGAISQTRRVRVVARRKK